MKHTSNPWLIDGQDIIGNDVNGYICTWSGRSADAKLIAAAPDLLEALKAAREVINKFPRSYGYYLTDLPKIDEAIKKAESNV